MTTRSIVPNGDGEGSLGTSTAKWGAVYSSDPASGENSGQVPTTAWVQKLLADALAKQKAAYEQAISTAVSAAQTKAKLDAHPVGPTTGATTVRARLPFSGGSGKLCLLDTR